MLCRNSWATRIQTLNRICLSLSDEDLGREVSIRGKAECSHIAHTTLSALWYAISPNFDCSLRYQLEVIMAKKRHVPPSRRRYEQSHPTVSVRVSRDVFDQLKMLKQQSSKSVADVLKEALGTQAPSVKRSHQLGYMKGLAEAEKKYRIDYRCSVCGGTITLASVEEKQAVTEYMRENGWAHGSCRD